MITLKTNDGGTVQVTRRANATDIHLRNAQGRTVATVVKPHADATALLKGIARH